MHRVLRRLSICVAAVLVAAGISVSPGNPAEAAVTKMMIVGDSISQGAEGDFTWRYRLAERYAAGGVPVDFVGPWTGTKVLNADHADQGISHNGAYRPGISFDSDNLAQWGWQMHQAKDVIGSRVGTYQPDFLLVELGFNDLGWGVNDPAGLLNDLEWFIYHARAAKPNIKIAFADVPHRTPIEVQPDLPAKITEYNNLLAARIPQLTSVASPLTVVDVDLALDELGDTYDGLHPNVRGEYAIAKAFGDRLLTGLAFGTPFGSIPATLPAPLAPGAPTSITATPVDDKIKVSWSHVFGATGYEFWQRDATAGGAWQKGQFEIGADSWTADLLPAGRRMEFQVRTTRGTRQVSAPSATASATVRAMPDVPNVRVEVSPDQPYAVTVRWDPVAGADDYFVYSAPGCDVIPPASSSFTQAQWGLAGKTSWTQNYVTDTCRYYTVVASRYGGGGPIKPANSRRAVPYQNNLPFFATKARYMTDAPSAGDQRFSSSVPAGTSDRGMVVVRGFIKNDDPFETAIGDKRGFSSAANSSAKIGVAWDTLTGQIGVYVHKSCVVGYDLPSPWEAGCFDALPVRQVPDATVIGDNDVSYLNYVSVTRSGSGALRLSVSARNSASALLGRINATVELTPVGDTYSVRLVSDRFPSWEVYHFPAHVQAPPLNGVGKTLATRGQGNIGDLTSGQMSVCTSQPTTTDHLDVNPMNCP